MSCQESIDPAKNFEALKDQNFTIDLNETHKRSVLFDSEDNYTLNFDKSFYLSKEEDSVQSQSFVHETFNNVFDAETIAYLITQESEYSVNPHYLDRKQRNIKWQARAILFDWMQEVCSDYIFKRETCYYAMNYVDRFLNSKTSIELKQLQLVGIGSIFLAAKLEEVYTPKMDNMLICANKTYSEAEILQMEASIYGVLGFHLVPPTVNTFMNWYIMQWDNFLENSPIAK